MQECPWNEDFTMNANMAIPNVEAYHPLPPATFAEILIRQHTLLHGEERVRLKHIPEGVPILLQVRAPSCLPACEEVLPRSWCCTRPW